MNRTHPTGINILTKFLPATESHPNLDTVKIPFFLVYGRDPNLPLHQLLEPMQQFLGYQDSGMLNLETHSLALVIAKKTLDENHFKTAQKTMDRIPLSFKIRDRVNLKDMQHGKWYLKWRPRYRIVLIECNGHFLHIENQATGKVWSCYVKDVVLEPPAEFGNIDTKFSRAGKFINHPVNLLTISLHD